MRTKASRGAALAVALVLAGGACTAVQEAEGPNAVASGAPTPEPTQIDSALPTPSASPPVFEDEAEVLRVAIREPSTLDPMRIQDPGSVLIARQLYEGLTRWEPATESVKPAVAASWSVSDGGKDFTFKLRRDATFHDGSPVEAEDFSFAFDRIARRKSGADVAYLLELVVGFDEVNRLGTSRHLRGIKTPDRRTLVIELSEPYRNFPSVLTHPSLVPLKEKLVEDAETFVAEPTGNGPFEIARPFEVGQPVVLRAYEGYPKTVGLDGIRFIPYPDAAASWIPFNDGEIDVAEVPTGRTEVAGDEFGERGFQPLLVGAYFGLNITSDELDDVGLRTAINRGIDRAALRASIFKETLVAPRGIVPPGMPGFEGDACKSLCDYAPAVARSMVRKLPRDQRAVSIQYTLEPPQGKVAREVAEDLRNIGLDVKLEAYPFGRYLRVLARGTQSMYRLGWIAEYPDPDVFLNSLFNSASPDNHSGLDAGEVDRLLNDARAEPSEKRRLALYRKAEKKILARVPIVPLGSFVMYWVAQPWVENINFDVLGGFDAGGVTRERD